MCNGGSGVAAWGCVHFTRRCMSHARHARVGPARAHMRAAALSAALSATHSFGRPPWPSLALLAQVISKMALLIDRFGANECLSMLDRIEEVLKGKVRSP